MNKIGYRSLIVWQKADLLAKEIYKETKSFPHHEIFGVTSQLRRAALSVPTNIVEGYGRFGVFPGIWSLVPGCSKSIIV